MSEQRIEIVGKLGSTYGIRGWLRIYSSTAIKESIFEYLPWYLKIKGKWQLVELENWRHHNHDLIVKLKNVDDRDAAQTLTNVKVGVKADVFPELEAGEYYWHDLIGCQVINSHNYDLGKVTDLMETGSNDVMVVRANKRDAYDKQERLIPFLDEQVVKRVDLNTKTITVDWDADF